VEEQKHSGDLTSADAPVQTRSAAAADGAASAASEASEEEAMLFCPLCSQRLDSRKCKLVCQGCGYYMSCADYI
jgi:hypothetical protein